jgi:hypothetical protein
MRGVHQRIVGWDGYFCHLRDSLVMTLAERCVTLHLWKRLTLVLTRLAERGARRTSRVQHRVGRAFGLYRCSSDDPVFAADAPTACPEGSVVV